MKFKDGLRTNPRGVTTMSTAPLSARLFRFLTVVASAPLIVLMLVAGSLFTMVLIVSAFSSVSVLNLEQNNRKTHTPTLIAMSCEEQVNDEKVNCLRESCNITDDDYQFCITECQARCEQKMASCGRGTEFLWVCKQAG